MATVMVYGVIPKLEYDYDVTIDTTSLPEGSYSMVASLNTGNADKPAFVSAEATFKIDNPPGDTTAPGSISGLHNISYAPDYINWTWTDPTDTDFSKVIVSIDGGSTFEVLEGTEFYNATGFAPNTEHTISTRTVDTSGNINETWVNRTNRTAPMPPASPIQVAIEINPNTIKPKSNEEIKVTIFNNDSAGFDVGNINISTVRFGPNGTAPFWNNSPGDKKLMLKFYTKDTGIQCGDTQATLTGKTNSGQDIIGSDSFKTTGCESAPGSGNSGGSSGGSGVISSEPFDNIFRFETVDGDFLANRIVKYTYSTLGLYEIDVTGSENENAISIRVEELKGTSKLVKESAPGSVYRNFNIWAGTKKIKDARLRYKIENSWLESNGLESSDVKILRWSENKWQLLDTAEIKNDGTYTFVEADTPGFSSFVLTGLKGGVMPTTTPTVTQQPEETSTGTGTATTTQTPTSEAPPVNLATIMLVIVLIAIVAVVYIKRKEIFKR